MSKGITVQITPKGVAVSAQLLFEMGFLSDKTRAKVIWFVDSGIGWENKEFRRLWRKVQTAACRAYDGKAPFRATY